jgi:hypothetical protein
VRFSNDEIKLMTLAAKATKQTVSQLVRQAVRAAYSWALICKSCGAGFTYMDIDEQHPRQTVNNMPEVTPAKPPLRNGDRITCPHCNYEAVYSRHDLRFVAN